MCVERETDGVRRADDRPTVVDPSQQGAIPGIDLNRDIPSDVDTIAFDAAIRRGDAASLQEAADLYRGSFLDGCHETWAHSERVAREEAYLKALERLAGRALEAGEPGAAVGYLRRIVAVDPARESAQRRLMEALAAGNDHAAVTRAYREFRLYLHRTLNATPTQETTDLYHRLEAETHPDYPSRTPDPLALKLPTPLTAFIGAEDAVSVVADLCRTERLVTLVGIGGIGKTRLALEAAKAISHRKIDSVWFVDLSPVVDAEILEHTVADVVGVPREGGSNVRERLVSRLTARSGLLCLDNCEHLLDECSVLAHHLVERCPDLHILATSRLPLRVPGERTFPVPVLSIPPPSAAGAEGESAPPGLYDAVRLFVERASRADPDFQITDANETDVSRICRRLEGIPLALELAAAWAPVLSPAQMVERLATPFSALTTSRRVSNRQPSLRAVVEATINLLPDRMQRVFAALSVFRGGWDVDAAQAVAEDDGEALLATLATLRERSLITVVVVDGVKRFGVLETLREYCAERLTPTETEALQSRHRRYFLSLAEAAEPNLYGPEQMRWQRRLRREYANLRAALTDALTHESDVALKICAALARYWDLTGQVSEGRHWLSRALSIADASSDAATRFRALLGQGRLVYRQSDLASALRAFEEAHAFAVALGDPVGEADARTGLGLIALSNADYPRAGSQIEAALETYRQHRRPHGEATALHYLSIVAKNRSHAASRPLAEQALACAESLGDPNLIANILHELGNIVRTEARYYTRALELYRLTGNRYGEAIELLELGRLMRDERDFDGARSGPTQVLRMLRQLGDPFLEALCLGYLGDTELFAGDPSTGSDHLRAAIALLGGIGNRREYFLMLEALASCQEALGERGRALRLAAAAAALRQSVRDTVSPGADRWNEARLNAWLAEAGMQERREVLDLVAGWTQDQTTAYALATAAE